MSVKTKLSFMISLLVFIMLALNVILSAYSTRVNLQSDVEANMMAISQQIAVNVMQNSREHTFIHTMLAEKLKTVSDEVAGQLPKSAYLVTNQHLVELAKQLDIAGVSVMLRDGSEYLTVRSSDPLEIGVSRTAAEIHQPSKSFWTPSYQTTLTDHSAFGLDSYYSENDTNYVIHCYMRSDQLSDYEEIAHTTSFLTEMRAGNPTILEVTGFNPTLFAHMPESQVPQYVSERDRTKDSIPFGSYGYQEIVQDKKSVGEALAGKPVFRYENLNNHSVIKSFVAAKEPIPYVIGLVFDQEPMIELMKQQRNNQITISVLLLVGVIFCSYWLAGLLFRPVRSILWKINEVSFGRFDNSIEVRRKDELGQLAQRVNAMSKNLGIYMTKLKMAFEENRSMKEHLESFINHTTDAIHVVDLDGRTTQVNRAFEELFGYDAEAAVGQVLPLVPEHLALEEQKSIEQLRGGKTLAARETLRVTSSGEWIAVSATTSPIRDKNGEIRGIASITRDMTSRNKMEELLRRSEKLTTVGQLAAGVAHEIRNPLTTLRGFLQLQLETKRLNAQHVDLMLSEIDRINLIVGEFLILAKPQATRFEEKDVRFILGDVISLLDSEAHLCNIEFLTVFEQAECRISCEENQLKQVFINVLKNAIEAMQSGGQITIEVRHDDPHHVKLSITDEGIGIPEDRIPMLGNPFYTDKDKGTGLGIMVSQRIIQGHHGTLEIQSRVGVGTKVIITLPLLKP
ncbi:two-component system, sporulation sensor kinase E [Paenibacillus taihuensis]|uniref:histidine kinase n=1 Tax=Paenibacillus taihuensis TaxID=1156355 RepID=A0A3D9S5K9_9BACL|nr:ATP-binding protein [Paenibacillus taihuensis]REE83842.1 two-component system, sporulation sensor kinase E [Paenibacillus taihuensis]